MNEQNAGTEGATTGSKERAPSGITAKSHEAAEQLKNAVVDQADQVRHKADSARDHAAERFRRVASHLRNVGDNLRSDDQIASKLAERASRSVEGVADYVASTDVKRFMRDTEQLARRQPALFFGSAFLVGLAIGRFLKSAPPDRAEESWSSSGDPARREEARDQSRRSAPPAPNETNQRFRENYDAAFARDIPSSPAEGTSRTPPGPGARATKGSPERTGERIPESNGGRSGGKGKVS